MKGATNNNAHNTNSESRYDEIKLIYKKVYTHKKYI